MLARENISAICVWFVKVINLYHSLELTDTSYQGYLVRSGDGVLHTCVEYHVSVHVQHPYACAINACVNMCELGETRIVPPALSGYLP